MSDAIDRKGDARGINGGDAARRRKIAGVIVLVLLMILFYWHNIHEDAKREREHRAHIDKMRANGDKRTTEQIVRDCMREEQLKVRRTNRMNSTVILGFIRAAIMGTILGGDVGSLEGMLSLGAMNGVLFWFSEHLAML